MSAKDNSPKARLKRKLTPFLAQEMLYDYATGSLDADREGAIKEYLETDRESQNALEQIKQALEYVDQLAKTEIEAETLVHLKDAESALSLGKKYSSWTAWPETLRWSITAITISFTVAFAVLLVPWNELTSTRKNGTVEVARIPVETSGDEPVAEATPDEQGAAEEIEGSGDEIADVGEEAGHSHANEANAPTVPVAAVSPSPVQVVKVSPAPVAGQAGKPSPSPATAVAAATTASNTAANTVTKNPPANRSGAPADETDTAIRDGKPKGFVYRAFMTLADLDSLGPQIADDIRALGAEKAGEVELGWNRGAGRYYHFSLPEENEKKVIERLQVYGPVRISKDPHPRIMPTGQVRFILWVESAPQ